jgi:hypothetical protein
MLRLTNLDRPRQKVCCVVLVLLAVCALTLSVATRYSSTPAQSNSARILHKQLSLEQGRQRLTKSANAWFPPVVRIAAFQAPTAYPRIAPSGPPVPSLFFEDSLYYRPPPSC